MIHRLQIFCHDSNGLKVLFRGLVAEAFPLVSHSAAEISLFEDVEAAFKILNFFSSRYWYLLISFLCAYRQRLWAVIFRAFEAFLNYFCQWLI